VGEQKALDSGSGGVFTGVLAAEVQVRGVVGAIEVTGFAQ
jgi:hypothetical protein